MPVSGSGPRWSARERRIAYRARMAELSRRQEAKRAAPGPIEVLSDQLIRECVDRKVWSGISTHITPWFIEDGLPTRRVGDLEKMNVPIP